MNLLDIILIVCFGAAVVRGIMKGFIEQAMALISIILGVWMSYKFTKLLCGWMHAYIEISDTLLYVICFILIFVAVVLVLHLLCKLIKVSVNFVMLGWLDKLLGVVFALLKTALVVGLIIILFNTLNTKFGFVSAETLGRSKLYMPLKDFAYAAFPYLKMLLFNE